jgi:hypothetical protein
MIEDVLDQPIMLYINQNFKENKTHQNGRPYFIQCKQASRKEYRWTLLIQ